MSIQTRQPAGVPVGGQFAATVRPENGTALHPSAVPDRHRGTCSVCNGPSGVIDDQVEHLDDDGIPFPVDQSGHHPDVDPTTYTGLDVETVAQASGWGSTAWENFEDARVERDLADARLAGQQEGPLIHSAGAGTVTCYVGEDDQVPVFQIDTSEGGGRVRINLNDAPVYDGDPDVDDSAYERASAIRGNGIDLTGTADEVWSRAQKAIWDAEVVYELAGAKAAAQAVLRAHPTAAVLELTEDYDDDGSTHWSAGRVLDATGAYIGDFEDGAEDYWSAVSDLPTTPKRPVHPDPSSTGVVDVDPRYSFMTWTGDRRRGYSGTVDLKAAAAIDLTTILDAR